MQDNTKTKKSKIILIIILCVFISLTYFLFNLSHLSLFIDSDIYAYTQNVEQGHLVNLFNPHHLMFDYFGYIFYQGTKHIDNLGADVLFNQRIKNLIFASIGAGLIFLFLFLISRRIFLSLIFTGLITFARGYLSYAGLNDTPTIQTVLCIILFFLLFFYKKIKFKKSYAVFLGLFHSIVIFFHQANVLFYPVVVLLILLSYKDVNLKKRMTHVFLYTFTLVLIVSAVYLLVGLFIIKTSLFSGHDVAFFRIKGTGNFLNWLSFYAHKGVWGSGHQGNAFYKILYGFTGALVQGTKRAGYGQNAFDFSHFFSSDYGAVNVMFSFILIMFILYLIFFLKLYKKYGPITGALLLWFVVYFIFYSWWEPEYFEFWLVSASTVFIIIFFFVNYILDLAKQKFVIKFGVNFCVYIILIAALLIQSVYNYYYVVYPRSKIIRYGWLGSYKEKVKNLNLKIMYK